MSIEQVTNNLQNHKLQSLDLSPICHVENQDLIVMTPLAMYCCDIATIMHTIATCLVFQP
jgi:hypothetical protein